MFQKFSLLKLKNISHNNSVLEDDLKLGTVDEKEAENDPEETPDDNQRPTQYETDQLEINEDVQNEAEGEQEKDIENDKTGMKFKLTLLMSQTKYRRRTTRYTSTRRTKIKWSPK